MLTLRVSMRVTMHVTMHVTMTVTMTVILRILLLTSSYVLPHLLSLTREAPPPALHPGCSEGRRPRQQPV
jgi:hypothetical protein